MDLSADSHIEEQQELEIPDHLRILFTCQKDIDAIYFSS